jgi:hypothetical protein
LGIVPALVALTQRLGDRRAGAVAGADEQHRDGHGRLRRPGRHGPQRRVQCGVQCGTGGGEALGAALQGEVVVAVAAVETASRRGDQAAVAQQAQVIGDEVLWLAGERHELAHPQVAAGQGGQQPPPHRVAGQTNEFRTHPSHNTSNQFDRPSGTITASWESRLNRADLSTR